MLIEYTCADGSRTVARWPSIALLHWLGRFRPHRLPENPEPFKVYIVRSSMPSDTDPLFLPLVYAECEHRWNRRPPFEAVAAGETQEQPREDRFHHPPGGQAYQECCLAILRFLQEIGDIVEMKIEEEE
jgi:hypothetical protein